MNPHYAKFLKCVMDHTDILVGDSCQPTYHAMWALEPPKPRAYFHSASGFGTLGYALPASIGAKVGNSSQRVTCLIGDGGLLFTLPELHCAVTENLPLAVLVWDNSGYREIEKATSATGGSYQCQPMQSLAYDHAAKAFHSAYARVDTLQELGKELDEAHNRNIPTLIHVNQQDFIANDTENWYL